MVGKYLINTIRKHPLRYAVIAICEIIMIIIALFALSVILDYASDNENNLTQFYAKEYVYAFDIWENAEDDPYLSEEDKAKMSNPESLPQASVMHSRIYEFCEKSPVKINRVALKLGYMNNSYKNSVLYFQNYDDMLNYCTKQADPPLSCDSLPTKEQFENNEKVLMLGTGLDSDSDKYVFSDEQHLLFGNDDEYLIVGEIPWNVVVLFLGSEPDDAKINRITIYLDSIPTQAQADEIDHLFREIVIGEYASFCSLAKLPEIQNLLDMRKDAATILITVLLMIIMSFNYITIVKFMIERRKADYAVFRLCGFSKWKALIFPMIETITISAVCVVISCVIFEMLKSLIALYSPVVYSMFDFGCYLCFSLVLIIITLVLFLIYVLPSLNKSVSDELRDM